MAAVPPLLAILAGVIFAAPAAAGSDASASMSVCGDDARAMAHQLRRRYGEVPRWAGVTADGHYLVLFQAADGSWSIVLNMPAGDSCLAAHGHDGEILAPSTSPTKVPAVGCLRPPAGRSQARPGGGDEVRQRRPDDL